LIVSAWTIIFILSTFSLLILWNKYSSEKKFGLIISLFIMNALLVVGWNVLFFSHQQLALAFFLALLIVINSPFFIILIWRVSPLASYLLIPYSLYIIFSTILTYNVWMLN
jgi:tryptophan-rich sensory protein